MSETLKPHIMANSKSIRTAFEHNKFPLFLFHLNHFTLELDHRFTYSKQILLVPYFWDTLYINCVAWLDDHLSQDLRNSRFVQDVVVMQWNGVKLDKKDLFGKSDPFLMFYRTNDDNRYLCV